MSSTYLTSNDMKMIERLLAEAPKDETYASSEVETAQVRLLIHAFESGISTEAELRGRLVSDNLTRGGTRTEVQRRIDNDTNGTRRRAREMKERHQLV
ncbi:hypothetical protein KEU06_27585 [Pseudaminobacter sp. 19-2017]|uniref:Uncharacterized protein n=1 Tax=Pseudaminobacter soli (ex Zhang et al. 2022) TaxID=2831468 RepID=A0A942E749_9HYPH|nr:hypothetical protein [Pseudaminobacter soli]MBS3652358.1 hypothetical protein [Pseudaminobacter soli]